MIKQLSGLRVNAIAVEIPDGYEWKIWSDGKTLSGIEKGISNLAAKKYIDLPPGQWVILGRAGELTIEEKRNLLQFTHEFESAYEDLVNLGFDNYRSANSLTNELILIKNEREIV